MAGLSPVDGWTAFAILAKAAGYAATLLAMGGPLFLLSFPRETERLGLRPLVVRVAVAAAALLLAVLALRFGIRAARISGMGWAAMADPLMLGFVWDSPLGTAALWRGAGAALVLLVVVPSRIALGVAVAGASMIAVSYAQVGHSLGEPRAWLAALLVLHLLAVAWWIGALPPLRRAADRPDGAALLHGFGTIATGIVGLLVVAGVTFAWLVSGSPAALIGSAYGSTLLAKVALVSGLLALAAANKLRLVPALAEGRGGAAASLRRSIAWEMAVVALVLLATAALTTITTPPVVL